MYKIIGIEKGKNEQLNGVHLTLRYKDKNVQGIPIKKAWLNEGVFPTNNIKIGMLCDVKAHGYYIRNIKIIPKISILKRVFVICWRKLFLKGGFLNGENATYKRCI